MPPSDKRGLDSRRLDGRHFDGPVAFRGGGFAPDDRAWAAAADPGGSGRALAGGCLGRPDLDFVPARPAVDRPGAVGADGQRRTLAALSASLLRLAIGWTVGTLAGIGMGLAVGLWSALRSPGMALVSVLFPIPKIALVPLFIIWFGIGEGSKIVTLAFGVFFPTVIATAGGVDNVPRGLIRMGQSFGLSHGAIVRKIILPAALPAILSGFRVTSSIAIVLLVAAEMIGAERGIGAFILSAGNLYDMDNLLAGIAVLSMIGLLVSWVIGRLERAFLAWRA